MAEADLDILIRQIAKAQNKNLIAAVKKRRDQIMARAAKAQDKETRDRFRLIARSTLESINSHPHFLSASLAVAVAGTFTSH